MSNEQIGKVDCEECGASCPVRESKNGYAYYTCEECGLQHFTRGRKSDASLRARMTVDQAAPAADPLPTPAPAPADPVPAPQPEPAGGGSDDWGI